MDYYSENRPLMLVLSGDAGFESRIGGLAIVADWRSISLSGHFDWPGDRAAASAPLLILCDIRSGTETPEREIARAAQYAEQHDIALIVWTDMERLDEAAYLVAATDAQLLVDPEPAETVYALTKARGRKRGTAREEHGDSRQLMRLSDELVEMARRVAALTRDGSGGGQVRADPLGYRGAPPGSASPLGKGAVPPIKAGQVREMIRLRRMREEMFESDLFADPAWDMLLDLMASRLEDKPVSVSSLCIASAVPATTALRWIKLMTDRGLFKRRADAADARRIFIVLNDETADRLQRLLATMLASGAPIV